MSASVTTVQIPCPECGVVQEATEEKWVFGGGQAVEKHIQEKECPVCGATIGGEDGS